MTGPVAATRDTLTRIIEMQPGTESAARAHYELGLLQLERGDLEVATASFRLVPPHWTRWHGLAGLAIARLYETQIRDLDAASREYRKVIRRHPESFAAAECHARLADLHEALGDTLSAENMRECAMRAYQRVIETTRDDGERDEALTRFVATSRELERWDAAIDALSRQRRAAVKAKDSPRRNEIDRQLGDIHFQREQHEQALPLYRECLQHARRLGDVHDVVALCERIAACLRATEDITGARRAMMGLVEFVSRDATRLSEAHRDARLAPALGRAFVALDKPAELRRMRSRIARMTSGEAKAALAALEAAVPMESAHLEAPGAP